VAIGEYGISLDKLVAAAETLEADQKSVALTTTLLEESKVALFLETLFHEFRHDDLRTVR